LKNAFLLFKTFVESVVVGAGGSSKKQQRGKNYWLEGKFKSVDQSYRFIKADTNTDVVSAAVRSNGPRNLSSFRRVHTK
jgi:hypothetical protein